MLMLIFDMTYFKIAVFEHITLHFRKDSLAMQNISLFFILKYIFLPEHSFLCPEHLILFAGLRLPNYLTFYAFHKTFSW
jgi:hypothetical protein